MPFINTRDVIGDQATLDGLVAHTLTELKESGVNRLGAYAFYKNTGIISVEFPGLSDGTICTSAFYNCTHLTTAAFPDITNFATYMFNYCTSLTDISAPVVTYGGQAAFMSCSALETVNFPMMRGFGQNIFQACVNLSAISFSTSLTSIATSAFQICYKLESINLSNVTSISAAAFYACTQLSSVSLQRLKNLGYSAFLGCHIPKLILPVASYIGQSATDYAREVDLYSQATIDQNAFYDDINLFSLLLRSSAMTTLRSVNAFGGTPIGSGYGKVYVPGELVSSYREATNWAYIAEHIESLENYTDGGPTGGETITDSWATILTNNNYATDYSIGDTKWLPAMDSYILMQIVAFDADELSDNTGYAHITWLCKGYQGLHKMNLTDTISGGWASSDMRTWLINDVLPTIDPTVSACIKTVKKTFVNRLPTAGTYTSNDDIWIPSAREIFGGTNYESSGCVYTGFFADSTSRVKYRYWTSSHNDLWWLRTVNNNYFACVNNSGSFTGNYPNGSNGVVFGFCT